MIYIAHENLLIGTKRVMLYCLLFYYFYGFYQFWDNPRLIHINRLIDDTYYQQPHTNDMTIKVQFAEHLLHFADLVPLSIKSLEPPDC